VASFSRAAGKGKKIKPPSKEVGNLRGLEQEGILLSTWGRNLEKTGPLLRKMCMVRRKIGEKRVASKPKKGGHTKKNDSRRRPASRYGRKRVAIDWRNAQGRRRKEGKGRERALLLEGGMKEKIGKKAGTKIESCHK